LRLIADSRVRRVRRVLDDDESFPFHKSPFLPADSVVLPILASAFRGNANEIDDALAIA
jgi:hypothetical protein